MEVMSSYSVELAKSGRSTCKKCKEKITEKTIRIGKKQKLPGDIISIAWNHLGCVVVPKSSTTEYFIENLEGFTDLNSEDQATVRDHFTALAEKRSTPSKQASPTPKKKAKAVEAVTFDTAESGGEPRQNVAPEEGLPQSKIEQSHP